MAVAQSHSRARELGTLTAVLVVLGLLLGSRLTAFGIWDPWELDVADAARRLLEGKAGTVPRPRLDEWLIALGFQLFGTREWAGRLPMLLAGLLSAGAAFALVRRHFGTRAGTYAALIAGSSPLMVFNARSMLGVTPSFAAQAWLAVCLAAALFPGSAHSWRTTLAYLAGAAIAVGLCIFTSGGLLGALPPLLAASAAAATHAELRSDHRRIGAMAAYGVMAATATLLIAVTHDVVADQASYSPWLGGRPTPNDPPSFQHVIENVFHGFAPWSTLLPLALGRLLLPVQSASQDRIGSEAVATKPGAHDATSLRFFLVLWASFGYAAHTLYLSRYGTAVFLPIVAVAGAVALFLRDIEDEFRPHRTAALLCLMFTGLLLRDFGLYPDAPAGALKVSDLEAPESFRPLTAWAATLGLFGVCAALGLATPAIPPEQQGGIAWKAPYRLLREQWQRGWGFRVWLLAAAGLGLLLFAIGSTAWLAPRQAGMTTLAARWGRRIMWVPLLIPPIIAVGQLARTAFLKLGARRLWPLLAAGVLVGGYAAQGYLPALSTHFSPRDVYQAYNTLAAPDEPLGEFRVGSRAAAYYAEGPVKELQHSSAVVRFLREGGRRWVAFPSERLARIDQRFRRKTGEHLFVVDTGSARVTLATDRPVANRRNANPLARFVRTKAPQVERAVDASFDEKATLIGYDMELPHGDYVGAGEHFTIRWVYRVKKPIAGNYKVFVHIDGFGLRLNGDHDPVDGTYPTSMWKAGDVIVDEQRLQVPANFRAGRYTIFVGLFRGSQRLEVASGPQDDTNRVRAGVLHVR